MTVAVVVKGMDRELALVESMMERLRDLTPVMAGRAQAFETMIQKDVFGRERDPWDIPWKPLSEDRIKERLKRHKSREGIKILTDLGEMKSSVFAKATKQGMVFGASDAEKKVNPHLFGVNKAGHRLPPRPFLPVDKEGEASFVGGPALEWLERTQARILAYVETGKV